EGTSLMLFILIAPRPPSTHVPYTTLFRSRAVRPAAAGDPDRRGPDARPPELAGGRPGAAPGRSDGTAGRARGRRPQRGGGVPARSEEHTSELQSRENLVCRLLLEKKK